MIRSKKQIVYRDEATGIERHLLSPSFPAQGIEFILNVIPHMEDTRIFPSHKKGVKEYIYVA